MQAPFDEEHEQQQRWTEINGVITKFVARRSPFEGTATIRSGGLWGTVYASGFFFDPLPGMEIRVGVEARRNNRRQPSFTASWSESVGFQHISAATVQRLAELGGIQVADPVAAADALTAGDPVVRKQMQPGFDALTGARDLYALLKSFPFAHPPTAEMARVLHGRGIRPADYARALKDNPYLLLLLREYRSQFGWSDQIAATLGADAQSPDRLVGAMRSVLVRTEFQGSNAMKYSRLTDEAKKTVSKSKAFYGWVPSEGDLASAASLAISEGDIVPVATRDKEYVLSFPEHAHRAKCIHDILASRTSGRSLATRLGFSRHDLGAFLQSFPWNDGQLAAFDRMANEPVSFLIGPPGTGKTKVIGEWAKFIRQRGGRVAIGAPTGLAAKRVGNGASTLHRMLGFNGFEYTTPYIEADLLIVDEGSQLTDELLLAILERYDGPILFGGDPDQLPPVGIGAPFEDMLASKRFAVSELTKIQRQVGQARYFIIQAARAALNGDYLEMAGVLQNSEATPYVSLIEPEEYSDDDAVVRDVVLQALARGSLERPLTDLQVLSRIAKIGPLISAQHLHEAIRDHFNPRPAGSKPFIVERDDGYAFEIRQGDRVMQTTRNVNEAHLRLANGDLMHVEDLNDRTITARLVDTGEVFRMTRNDCRWLVGGFASSIHKTQGSQYPEVAIALSYDERALPGQRMLYTAITRSMNRVTFCGARDSLRQAVWFEDVPRRETVLSRLLELGPEYEMSPTLA